MWLWAGVSCFVDYLGRASVINDLSNRDTFVGHAALWLFSTSSWVPAGLAALATAVFLWVMLRGPDSWSQAAKIDTSMAEKPNPTVSDSNHFYQGGQGAEAAASGPGSRVSATGGTGAESKHGRAGTGGSGEATGHQVYVRSGDGGNTGTPDGRGGDLTI